jgi:diguanylate cyclase (GGDEF)-like protein/PAS domain S-box-containing protein
VVANTPSTDPRSGGLPAGHPALNAFLGLPFYSRGKMIGMVGIANRAGGYTEDLIEFLSPFLVTCSNIIVALRANVERSLATERLQESEIQVRAILENAIDAIITIDETGVIESYNPATSRLFGYGDSELLGKNVSLLMPEPHSSRHDGYLKAYLRTGNAKVIGVGREVEGLRKDGSSLTLELAINQLQLGRRKMFVGILRDISDRKAGEQQLHRLNEELSRRVEDLHQLDHENSLMGELGSFLQACRSEEEAHQVLSACGARILPGTGGAYYRLEEQGLADCVATWGESSALSSVVQKQECWALRRGEVHVAEQGNGALHCSHASARANYSSACAPVMTQDGPIGLITLEWARDTALENDREVSLERHRALLKTMADRLGTALSNIKLRVRLEEDSIRDPLTRLYNRRFMDDWLRRELRRSVRSQQRISLIIGDIDHFKRLNDRYGHDMGDRVLQLVAQEMTGALREEDVVCRMGGEEFVLLLPGASLEAATERANQIRSRIKAMPISDGGKDLCPVTISMGVAMSPAHSIIGSELLKSADEALYRAKQAGRDRVEVAESIIQVR